MKLNGRTWFWKVGLMAIILTFSVVLHASQFEMSTYDPKTEILYLPAIEVSSNVKETVVVQAILQLTADDQNIVFELINQQESVYLLGRPGNALYDMDNGMLKVPVVEILGKEGNQFYTGKMLLENAQKFIVTELEEVNSALVTSLPKDPGKEGGSTVFGVDSDKDGVRDDIQRYITLNYPSVKDESIRTVLSNYAIEQQIFLSGADDPKKTLDNALRINKYVDCIMYLRSEDGYDIVEQFSTAYLNTEQRAEVYAKADNHLAGQAFFLTSETELASFCKRAVSSRTRDSQNDTLDHDPLCSSTYIAFVNGVKNPREAAYASLKKLRETLKDHLNLKDVNPKYVLIYNPTEGMFKDAFEVLTQKFLQIDSKDIEKHVALYKDWLTRNKRVIVISHSQGNLHANQSYHKLTRDAEIKTLMKNAEIENLSSHFTIVSVANPDQEVAGQCYRHSCSQEYYITLKKDKIVGSGILPGMPGNTENTGYYWKAKDKTYHNFVNTYLRGHETQDWIINTVKKAIEDKAAIEKPLSLEFCPPIYAVHDEGLNDSQFFTINPETYQVEKLGGLHKNANLEALDIDSTGQLYAVSSLSDNIEPQEDRTQNPGYLYHIDSNTGEKQLIGYTGFEDINSITFDKADNLWGWSKAEGAVQIDVLTGHASLTEEVPLMQREGVEEVSSLWENDFYFGLDSGLLIKHGDEKLSYPFQSKIEGLETVLAQDDQGNEQILALVSLHGNSSMYVLEISQHSIQFVQSISDIFKELTATNQLDIEGIAWRGESQF